MKAPSDARKIPDRHPAGSWCAATPPRQRGTVLVEVVGRALDAEGRPRKETIRQELYVEDRFEITVSMQEELATKATRNEGEAFEVPATLARLLTSSAYLGMLDVDPARSGGRIHVKLDLERTSSQEDGRLRLRLTGTSSASGGERGPGGDGRIWSHDVRLRWEGWIDLAANRVVGIVLAARGREQLKWGHRQGDHGKESLAAHLPAGRPFDLDTAVVYGMTGAPLPEDRTIEGEGPPPPGRAGPPASLQRKMRRLHPAVRRWHEEGRDPGPVMRRFRRRFEPLIRQRRFAEAETALDEILKTLSQ